VCVHKFSVHLGATFKFYMPQERHEESCRKTHNSGVICAPHYYLALSDWWKRSDSQCHHTKFSHSCNKVPQIGSPLL